MLTAYLGARPAADRSHASTVLSDPSLTGMTRDALEALIHRLSVRQTALAEQRRYKQRGGQRQPTARVGVFPQKITDADRVLATLLNQRKICNRWVLAGLFQVSPRTIGNAFLNVRPILEKDGYLATAGPFRFRTARDLLDSLAPPPNTPYEPPS